MARPPSYDADVCRASPVSGWVLLWPAAGAVCSRAPGDACAGAADVIDTPCTVALAPVLAPAPLAVCEGIRAHGEVVLVTWADGERCPVGRVPPPRVVSALKLTETQTTASRLGAPPARALREAAKRRARQEWQAPGVSWVARAPEVCRYGDLLPHAVTAEGTEWGADRLVEAQIRADDDGGEIDHDALARAARHAGRCPRCGSTVVA